MTLELIEVLRLLMLATKQHKRHGPEKKGGLLVLIQTETNSDDNFYCAVAAAGPWCAGVNMAELHSVFTDVMRRLHPCSRPCPEPDIEDLCAFTDLYGSLRVFLNFLMKNVHVCKEKCQHQIETFLHSFCMTNAEIKVHLKLQSGQKHCQKEFRVKDYLRVMLFSQTPVYLDVSVNIHLESPEREQRCHGGRPDIGSSLHLSIPPKIVEQGLLGTVSLQPVTLLKPCVLQYPNRATNLTQIQISFSVLVYNPSNIPASNASAFVQNFSAHLNCEDLGLQSHRLSFQVIPSVGSVYKVEQVNSPESCVKSSLFSIDLSLVLFLFLQHIDPFITDVSDTMATEVLLEHHLGEILLYNQQIVTNAMTNALRKTLMAQNKRKKEQEKMQSACDSIISSTLRIISCSSNMDFRKACLDSMQVHNTKKMSETFSESLRRVIFLKFVPKGACCSDQIGQKLEKSSKHLRVEM
ncbi:unnamed protein product [Knipowitschia caucasica]